MHATIVHFGFQGLIFRGRRCCYLLLVVTVPGLASPSGRDAHCMQLAWETAGVARLGLALEHGQLLLSWSENRP